MTSRTVTGVTIILVLAIACVGLTVALSIKTRNDAALASREVADYTPPSVASTSVDGRPLIALIGDESLSSGDSSVASLLEGSLHADVVAFRGAGAGYTTAGSSTATFVDEVSRVPSGSDVVVFVGGAADAQTSRIAVARSASQAFAEASRQAPTAQVLAVGPLVVPRSTTADEISAVGGAIRGASRIAGVEWIDPLTSRWLPDDRSGRSLTASDRQEVAARLTAQIKKALK